MINFLSCLPLASHSQSYGVGKSRRKLTKIAFIAAHNRWNQLNTSYLVVHLLNIGGNTLLISFGNSLPKEGTFGPRKQFPVMQCLYDQPLCKTLKLFSNIWFFLRSGLPWIIWRQRNDMVFNAIQWPIERTHQLIRDALHDYSRIEWKCIVSDLVKVAIVAYQGILKI